MQANEKIGEVIDRLGSAFTRLTVLRGAIETGPLSSLLALLTAAGAGDARAASFHASRLTSELVTCGARRVSGDLMMDFVLDTILLSDNAFASAAAGQRLDEAVFRAMRRDLAAMRVFSELDEDTVDRLVSECADAKKPDTAVKLATAAWGGAVPAPTPKERQPVPFRYDPPENCWHYGEFELRDSFCADAALEGMYRRFLENDDWAELASDLWSFHSAYGCGDFLRYRNFCLDASGALRPLPDLRAGDFVQLAEAEYGALLNNAIAFMRDESAKPMLLYGPQGMGKTTLMLELTDELPELRLVLCPPSVSRQHLLDAFDRLRAQPLKFMALLDDLNPASLTGVSEPMLPMNALVAACAPVPVLPELFEVTAELPRPQLNEFIRIVIKLLEADQMIMNPDIVRNACVDYQVDTRCDFNVAAAVRVKELLMS
ncbi:MAG: DUF815 domain-containing protein [Clostridia bacterium]|nr:DUF815 domain-containing protein [Clostridia bacterium]